MIEQSYGRVRVGSYTSTAFFFEQTDKDLISVFSIPLARSCTNLLSWRIGITEACGLALSASASAHCDTSFVDALKTAGVNGSRLPALG